MGRKESYSDRLKREGGMVASGKFREGRREATCECCRRNDAPSGERRCVSCNRHHDALVQERDEYAERLAYVREKREAAESLAQQIRNRAERADREVEAQMQDKLDAQSLLANICQAINLSRMSFDLNDTWRSAAPKIIERLTEIVDTAARWESIAAERGTRMDEIQARAEAAEAALAETRRALEEIASLTEFVSPASARSVVCAPALARRALAAAGPAPEEGTA